MWKRRVLRHGCLGLACYLATSLVVGWGIFPRLLLQAPLPSRTDAQREQIRTSLCSVGARWDRTTVAGGQGVPLDVWLLRRPQSRGVAVLLHGFGDDAWGTASMLRDLPDFDGVVWTFRGRDRNPAVPSTLGGWEPQDVVAVVRYLEQTGVPRSRILLVGASQGAGVALLALRAIESEGRPLLGALLESPWMDLRDAAKHHLRGTLGRWEPITRPAQWVGLWRAGRLAGFTVDAVSPLEASCGLRTPVALLTGDGDDITPVEGVRAIARHLPDLTVVPGAAHLEGGIRYPGGWQAWARPRLERWISGAR